jgi:pimeloyl-ACP methyl ester carboxylesterase
MNGTISPTEPVGALVLHGGGGPMTVAPLVQHVAGRTQVLSPTHPGWNGIPLPDDVRSIADLAQRYLDDLRDRGARNTSVIGSSIGGWIALEMAVRASSDPKYDGVIGSIVVIDAVGVDVPGQPIRDFFSLTPRTLAEYAWHDPERGYRDPTALTPDERQILASNSATMRLLTGDPLMHDPSLLSRLSAVELPALVVWGASDRIVTPDYGRAIAETLGQADFVEIPEAGHLPHLENPDATWDALDAFLDRVTSSQR